MGSRANSINTREITQEETVEIFNQIFWDGHITPRQKQGEILCLPKRRGTNEPRDLRPITLLNTDYKILARIIAQRLRPALAKHLKDTQFCGVPGNSILDAAATIRDIIAFAETEKVPLCLLSIDFKNAVDNIAHEYLFQTLKKYGICDPFLHGIMNMYEGASSFVLINGQSYGPHTHSMRCTSRMPNEHGPVRALPATLPPFPQPEDGRNQDREQNETHSRCRLCGRCNHIRNARGRSRHRRGSHQPF